MKTKLLLFLSVLFFSCRYSNAQCTVTAPPTLSYSMAGTYTIGNQPLGPIQLCANVILYDTSTGSSQKKYYLMPGSHLYLKNGFSHFVYLQGNAILTKLDANGNTFVYYETTATVSGTITPATTTCAAVSFPTVSCGSGTATAIRENNSSALISIFPNPAKNQITLTNENSSVLNATLMNTLGQKVRSFEIDNGKTSIDISALPDGIYFININDKNHLIATKKIIISK